MTIVLTVVLSKLAYSESIKCESLFTIQIEHPKELSNKITQKNWDFFLRLADFNPTKAANLAKIIGDATDVFEESTEKATQFMLEYLENGNALEFSQNTNPPFSTKLYPQLNYETRKLPFDHLVRYEECDEQKLMAILNYGVNSRARNTEKVGILDLEKEIMLDKDLINIFARFQKRGIGAINGGFPAVFVEATSSAGMVDAQMFDFTPNQIVLKFQTDGVIWSASSSSAEKGHMYLGGIPPENILQIVWFNKQGNPHLYEHGKEGKWIHKELGYEELLEIKESFLLGLQPPF